MHSRFAKGAGLVALWTLVGLILSTEVYFNVRMTRPETAFFDVAASQFVRALFWAAGAPLILGLQRAVPLHRGRWLGGIAFHAAMSALFMAAYYLGRIAVLMIREGEPLAEFWAMARENFFGRNVIDALFYWAMVGLGCALDLQRRYRHEETKAAQLESQLIEAELKALKQQLQPHFLFNTMNTISVLVREGKNDAAVNLIARLSTLLRLALDGTRVQEVTLRQEVDFLELYLEIQKVRFADRLSSRVEVEPAAWSARIPNLLLQPIVENAIVHGVSPKQGPGSVTLTARVHEGRLHLQIRDDGTGFRTDGHRVKEGIGLTNTRERLQRIYGANCQLVLKSEPGRGTTVDLVLPFRS